MGKELVARAIHRHSTRRDKPFIKVNCSALPESLIPSELFGHEKGAFTGAIRRRLGRFELADGGTLFLDEIGEISLDLQVRLLRVLQTREFERVGGSETIRSDFRLLVATNRNLELDVKTQKFRPDPVLSPRRFPHLRASPAGTPGRLSPPGFPLSQDLRPEAGEGFQQDPKRRWRSFWTTNGPGTCGRWKTSSNGERSLHPGPVFRVPELGSRFSETPPPGKRGEPDGQRAARARSLGAAEAELEGPGKRAGRRSSWSCPRRPLPSG